MCYIMNINEHSWICDVFYSLREMTYELIPVGQGSL